MTNTRWIFLVWHWLVPTALTIAVFILLRLWKIDEQLASLFYNGDKWPYKENWWLAQLIHTTGHTIALGAYVALVLELLYRRVHNYPSAGIAYALTAISLSVLAVALGKFLLHFPCPWDALDNSGAFTAYAWRPERSGCVPSGHASSGYAWLCFYYVARQYYPHLRIRFAAMALTVGLCFGIAQQMRGAHFLSHDLICLYVCWMVASLLYFFWPNIALKLGSSAGSKAQARAY